jgi:hypothetical protein
MQALPCQMAVLTPVFSFTTVFPSISPKINTARRLSPSRRLPSNQEREDAADITIRQHSRTSIKPPSSHRQLAGQQN